MAKFMIAFALLAMVALAQGKPTLGFLPAGVPSGAAQGGAAAQVAAAAQASLGLDLDANVDLGLGAKLAGNAGAAVQKSDYVGVHGIGQTQPAAGGVPYTNQNAPTFTREV